MVQELVARYPTIDHHPDKPGNDLGRFCDGVVFVGDDENRINKDGGGGPVYGVFNQLFHIYLCGDRATRTKLGFLLVKKPMAGTLSKKRDNA